MSSALRISTAMRFLSFVQALALLLQGRDVESGAALAFSVAEFHRDALPALARSERVEEGQLEATRGSALEANKGAWASVMMWQALSGEGFNARMD